MQSYRYLSTDTANTTCRSDMSARTATSDTSYLFDKGVVQVVTRTADFLPRPLISTQRSRRATLHWVEDVLNGRTDPPAPLPCSGPSVKGNSRRLGSRLSACGCDRTCTSNDGKLDLMGRERWASCRRNGRCDREPAPWEAHHSLQEHNANETSFDLADMSDTTVVAARSDSDFAKTRLMRAAGIDDDNLADTRQG